MPLVATFDLPPYGSGSLDGLRFAVKDAIDVAGSKPVAEIQRGVILIKPRWFTLCVWSNFWLKVPAAVGKRSVTNCLSVR